MGTITRRVRTGCEVGSAKSKYYPGTDLYKHGDASLAGSCAIGRAIEGNGADINRCKNSKGLRRVLVEGRHQPIEVLVESGASWSRSRWWGHGGAVGSRNAGSRLRGGQARNRCINCQGTLIHRRRVNAAKFL